LFITILVNEFQKKSCKLKVISQLSGASEALGLPRTYWGWASAERPLGTPPTGWCCKAHSEAHTENATEFVGQTPETAKLVSSCSEALAHYECQRRNFEIKTDNERTILVYEQSKTCIQNCSHNEKHASSLPPQRAAHLSYQSATHL
jgi:hypothetical protein